MDAWMDKDEAYGTLPKTKLNFSQQWQCVCTIKELT